MNFEISHEIEYAYSQPVSLGEQCLYIRPQENASQKLYDYHLECFPRPQKKFWFQDVQGNDCLKVIFRGKHDAFKVSVQSQVKTFRENPYDFIVNEEYSQLGKGYISQSKQFLKPYLSTRLFDIEPDVRTYAERVALKTGKHVVSFLSGLCHSVCTDFKVIHRMEGNAWSPNKTLQAKEGACRDLAMFFISCCQSQNLAARFVSGYYEADSETHKKDLHGWVEVYIEGAGWKGFDPSSGLAVHGGYVSLATSSLPHFVSPVSGLYYSSEKVKSKMKTSIEMRIRNQVTV